MSSSTVLLLPRLTLRAGALGLRLATAPARLTLRAARTLLEDAVGDRSPAVPDKHLRAEPARPAVDFSPPAADVAGRLREQLLEDPRGGGRLERRAPRPAPLRPDLNGRPGAARREAPPRRPASAPADPPPAEPLAAPGPIEPAPAPVEAELVAESADPGAADGAGAELRVEQPWPGYARLRAREVTDRLVAQSPEQLAVLLLYERAHRARSTVIEAAERELARRSASPAGG